MAIEAVVQFLEATSQNPTLSAGLAGIIGVGDGDISSAGALDQDEAGALLGQRSVLVTTFAEQNGHVFTVAEQRAVVIFGHPPFGVVIGDVERIFTGPRTTV